MAKRKPPSARVYRCKVDASVIMKKEERTIRLGPGLMLTEAEHKELMDRKLARPEWFEGLDAKQQSEAGE